ncbi:MAG: segregation/condensation protein A, partial [Chloroflexota bacterium]|nr:segregation/condensation protein A [Chloroflexota bacterium]
TIARPPGTREIGISVLPPLRQPVRGDTSVRIADADHPDRAAHISVEGYQGPLGLLLGLIEQRELDILDVPLGDLAGAYLEALASLDEEQMSHISSFVTVASQLILIKSRAILPRPPVVAIPIEEGPDPEAALRERLILYRMYRDAGRDLKGRLESGWEVFRREPIAAVASAKAGSRPDEGPPLDPMVLVEALDRALRQVPPPILPPDIVPRLVTLDERARIIRAALVDTPVVVLQDLLEDLSDRVVVAVTFLAMLELVKERELSVEQDVPFGPIVCRSMAPA